MMQQEENPMSGSDHHHHAMTSSSSSSGTAAASSSSTTSILSEKVQRALQIQTNTAAMKTALEALGQLSAASASHHNHNHNRTTTTNNNNTHAHSEQDDDWFALDARSVRHAIEYDALQQALSLRSELSSLCDTLQELRQGISQTAQIAQQVKQAIHAPVVVKSNVTAVDSSSKHALSSSSSQKSHESSTMTSSSSSGAVDRMGTGRGGGGAASSSSLQQQHQHDEERLAAHLAEAFAKRNLAKQRLQAVHQFLETFDLSEQDSQLLDHYNFDDLDPTSFLDGGNGAALSIPANGSAFLNALERVKRIREGLSHTFGSSSSVTGSSPLSLVDASTGANASSSSSLGASSALRMMEHLAQKQEQAFERLYHWLQSYLQLSSSQQQQSQQQAFNSKRVSFDYDSSSADYATSSGGGDGMDQALQHPFVQAALYTLRHVPPFYRHILELIASRRRQEETRIFLLALTSGYNGLPPMERLAHDPVAYVGDMLAFAFRSLNMEADVAMTIVHFAAQQQQQQQQQQKEENDDDEEEKDANDDKEPSQKRDQDADLVPTAANSFEEYGTEKPLTALDILSTIMSGMARPLKSRIVTVISALSSRHSSRSGVGAAGGDDDDDGGNVSDVESDDNLLLLDDYFEEKDASFRNQLTHLYDICGLLLFYISAMEKTLDKLETADQKHVVVRDASSSRTTSTTNNNALLVNLSACLKEAVNAFEATVRVYSATLGTLAASSGESAAHLAKALIVRIAEVRQSSPGFAQDVTTSSSRRRRLDPELESTLSLTWITTQVIEAALPQCLGLDDTVTLKSAVTVVRNEPSCEMDRDTAARLEEKIHETQQLLVDKLIESESWKVLDVCGLARVAVAWEGWKQKVQDIAAAENEGDDATAAAAEEYMATQPGLSVEALSTAMQDFDKSLYNTSIVPSLETTVRDASTRKLVRTKIADRVCQVYEELYTDIANQATGGYQDLSFLGHTPVQVRTLFSV